MIIVREIGIAIPSWTAGLRGGIETAWTGVYGCGCTGPRHSVKHNLQFLWLVQYSSNREVIRFRKNNGFTIDTRQEFFSLSLKHMVLHILTRLAFR